MGRRAKSQLNKGAGASTATPPAASSTADAPAPESVEFALPSVKEQLRARYCHACEQSANPINKPREQAQFAMLAARLLKDIADIAKFEAEQVQDDRLAALAEALEELQTKGTGRAGAADTEPPFDAPETPAPN